VSPEQGQRLKLLAGGYAHTGRHGPAIGAWAWHLGCLILAAGRGSYPALAVTAGGTPRVWVFPVVAPGPRLRR
jgi:hypothetical protein